MQHSKELCNVVTMYYSYYTRSSPKHVCVHIVQFSGTKGWFINSKDTSCFVMSLHKAMTAFGNTNSIYRIHWEHGSVLDTLCFFFAIVNRCRWLVLSLQTLCFLNAFCWHKLLSTTPNNYNQCHHCHKHWMHHSTIFVCCFCFLFCVVIYNFCVENGENEKQKNWKLRATTLHSYYVV